MTDAASPTPTPLALPRSSLARSDAPSTPRQPAATARSPPGKPDPEGAHRPEPAHPPPRAVERLLVGRTREVGHLLLGRRAAVQADHRLFMLLLVVVVVVVGASRRGRGGRRRGGRRLDGEAPAVPPARRHGVHVLAPTRLGPAAQLAVEAHARRCLDALGRELNGRGAAGGEEAREVRVRLRLLRRVAELRDRVGARVLLAVSRGRSGGRGRERRVGELRVAEAESAGRPGAPGEKMTCRCRSSVRERAERGRGTRQKR